MDRGWTVLRAMAALQGKTIKEYAMERLFPNATDDEQAMAALRMLLEQRLAEAARGDVVAKSMAEIAAEELSSGIRA